MPNDCHSGDPDGARSWRDHGPPARPRASAVRGTSSRLSPRSRPTPSRRPTRWPTRSRARTGTSCAASWAICCCRWSITRRWREEDGLFELRRRRAGDRRQDGGAPPACLRRRKPRQDQPSSRPRTGRRQRRRNVQAGGAAGVLDGVALGLPALMRALKLQKRAARVGFDWAETGEVVAQDRGGSRRAGRGAGDRTTPTRSRRSSAICFSRRSISRGTWSVDPEAALRARQRQVRAPVRLDRGAAGRSRAHARNNPTWPRWTRCGTRRSLTKRPIRFSRVLT